MNRALSLATNLFPVWVLIGGALALAHPSWFTWFSGDFKRSYQRPVYSYSNLSSRYG
jgi:hypothetical protein